MYLLDTDICIYLLNSRSASLLAKVKTKTNLCMSAVTYAELCHGIENGGPERAKECWAQLALFTRLVEILPFRDAAGKHYGRIRAHLKSEGRMIGGNDLLIVAHALSEGAVLVSNNLREFQRVLGLKVENWV
jgi:tRNA(fMet)-specific endonuclease VapC